MATVAEHAQKAARSHRHRREYHDKAVESALRGRPETDDRRPGDPTAGPATPQMYRPEATNGSGAQSH